MVARVFAAWCAVCLVWPGLSTAVTAQPAPPPAATPGPVLGDALKALEAARKAAAGLGVQLSCAVVDARGDLVALVRMDGARFFTTDVARGKALVSAMFGQPSGEMSAFETSPHFANLNTTAQGRLYPVQGGLPVARGTSVVGAIACSGATGQQDEDAARAGLALLQR